MTLPLGLALRLAAVADQADRAVVGPRDSRVQEIETARFPLRTICHLCRDFGDGECAGCTGTLIGPQLVLTAAHCLWSTARRAAPQRITVVPGRIDRDGAPFGSVTSTRYYAPQSFIEGREQLLWDFGVIVLPRPFAHARRFMPLLPLSDMALARVAAEGRLTIAGYPGDRPIGTLWRHSERLRKVTPRRLFYSVDTCPGHSGSPAWIERPTGPGAIAVHTMGILDAEGRSYGCARGTVLAPPGLLNSGVRLTPAVIDAIFHPQRHFRGLGRMVPLP